ncbi:MAG: ATP-dependent helicase/nuclease subunit A [Candidatus Tokpelaia sp. JSC188]|nr:MAG: ATP-dependent helicase/nuclease subunit A [Candidatus Tokpelaia sp. JSC188]
MIRVRKSTHSIPKIASAAQVQASNPQASVWLSANAGSGKTHVLTERVIRLLLEGIKPSRILCLTYTKAAASIMQKRIFDRLSVWTCMNDRELSAALLKLEEKPANDKRLKAARKLFASALETPGGLKIQTIHAFCEALLHHFPLEANIAGHFEIVDDMQQIALFTEAKQYLIETAYCQRNTELSHSFNFILAMTGEDGLERLLEEAIQKRYLLDQHIKIISQEADKIFRDILELQTNETLESLTTLLKKTALFPIEQLMLLSDNGGEHTARFVKKLQMLKDKEESADIKELCFSAYFNNSNDRPRKPTPIFTKAVQIALPNAIGHFLHKQKIVATLIEKLNAIELVQLNKAAYILMDTLLDRYASLKRVRALLDFDDLIYRSLALLKHKGASQWVQYKLDQGIDHILIDEAQDTSPVQWEIIRLLSDDFFSGFGQHKTERTVFAVGDEKQSIYSFQGAVPEDFAHNGVYISQKASNANKLFHKMRLDFSFRSVNDILSAVDIVFSTPENYGGMNAENEATVHDAVRINESGSVDIWQMLTPKKIVEPKDWRLPVDCLASPSGLLAGQIAQTIHTWLRNAEPLVRGYPIRANDIIVLVKKRSKFVHDLSHALKKHGVAVAGTDRLRLTDHIAIRDLMALGHFVLQPQDDLSLAAVLKSPLFGIDEEQLFTLAINRQEKTLWTVLKEAQDQPVFAVIIEELREYRAIADNIPVFEFYSRILSQNGGRRKILARLGAEANDVLDAFLDYILAIQKIGLPGLQTFLETLTRANPEIKRELDQNRDEIRIMTVHAAKGLEAPVVFLVDSGNCIWNSQYEPKLLPVRQNNTSMLIWKPSLKLKIQRGEEIIKTLKKKAEQEYRRLLYVGMTRASDKLIVCGYCGKRKTAGTWLSLVSDALLPYAESIPAPTEGVTAWRYRSSIQKNSTLEWKIPLETLITLPPVPNFLKIKAPPERGLPQLPLTPSMIIKAEPNINFDLLIQSPLKSISNGCALTEAIERGNVIHRLLQHLPGVEIKKRYTLALHYLQHILPSQTDRYHKEIVASVLALLEDTNFSPLFAKNSRAEVALMGLIEISGSKQIVSGQIDRLAIFDKYLLLADFKTGRPPKNTDEVPDSHLLQLALYIRLLESLYPQKEIRPLLIYTQVPISFIPDRGRLKILLAKLSWDTIKQHTKSDFFDKIRFMT